MTNRVATYKDLLPVLCEAIGVKVENVQRIVIDCSFNDIVRVYVQQVGRREPLLEFDWNTFLQGRDVNFAQASDAAQIDDVYQVWRSRINEEFPVIVAETNDKQKAFEFQADYQASEPDARFELRMVSARKVEPDGNPTD